jgi:hypothetical protein
VFGWVLALIARHGLVKGERIGIDAEVLGLDITHIVNGLLTGTDRGGRRIGDMTNKPPLYGASKASAL